MNILSLSTQEDSKNIASILEKTSGMNNKKDVCKILLKNIRSIVSFFYLTKNFDIQKHILYILFKNLSISSIKKFKIFGDYTQRFLEISSYNYKIDSISFLFDLNKLKNLISCCRFVNLEFKASAVQNGYSFISNNVIQFYAFEENFIIKLSSLKKIEISNQNQVLFYLISDFIFKFKVEDEFNYLDTIERLLPVEDKNTCPTPFCEPKATTDDLYDNEKKTSVSITKKQELNVTSSRTSILQSPIKCLVKNKNIISNNLNVDFESKFKKNKFFNENEAENKKYSLETYDTKVKDEFYISNELSEKEKTEIDSNSTGKLETENRSELIISTELSNEKIIKHINKKESLDKKRKMIKKNLRDFNYKFSKAQMQENKSISSNFKKIGKDRNILDVLLQEVKKIKLLKINDFSVYKRKKFNFNQRIFRKTFENIKRENKRSYKILKYNLKKNIMKRIKNARTLENHINRFILKFINAYKI